MIKCSKKDLTFCVNNNLKDVEQNVYLSITKGLKNELLKKLSEV